MVKKNKRSFVDCACVIHGNVYDWIYVEKLYNMVRRHINVPVQFHVYTEADRAVPDHMTKHVLKDWQISGPKKSWWYKMQLFNPEQFDGDLLYFDLDVIICRDISWILDNPTEKFWTIRDFRYLQKETFYDMNSSVMWWNVKNYAWVWDRFQQEDQVSVFKQYHGDQNYLAAMIKYDNRRYFEDRYFQSYRWQVQDGGLKFPQRISRQPGAGAVISGDTSVIVFHGSPKPHEVQDPEIVKLWV